MKSRLNAQGQVIFWDLLRPEGAVPIDPAASKEAVTYHTLAKHKKDDH